MIASVDTHQWVSLSDNPLDPKWQRLRCSVCGYQDHVLALTTGLNPPRCPAPPK